MNSLTIMYAMLPIRGARGVSVTDPATYQIENGIGNLT